MTDRLDLPDELKHLLEKREGERRAEDATKNPPPTGEERRQGDRRADEK